MVLFLNSVVKILGLVDVVQTPLLSLNSEQKSIKSKTHLTKLK